MYYSLNIFNICLYLIYITLVYCEVRKKNFIKYSGTTGVKERDIYAVSHSHGGIHSSTDHNMGAEITQTVQRLWAGRSRNRGSSPPSILSNRFWEPGREVGHSPASTTEVKNMWSCTSAPPYVSMAWCIMKHPENSTFTYDYNFATVTGYRSRGPGFDFRGSRFSEKQRVWNWVHSASWGHLRSYLKEK
jgi:hypothetical protein